MIVSVRHPRAGGDTVSPWRFRRPSSGNTVCMAESFADHDLATLRAIARGAGVPDADELSHDDLVAALRRAGLAEPGGEPVDTGFADPGAGLGVYHGAGVGRRETLGGAGAQPGGGEQPAGVRPVGGEQPAGVRPRGGEQPDGPHERTDGGDGSADSEAGGAGQPGV